MRNKSNTEVEHPKDRKLNLGLLDKLHSRVMSSDKLSQSLVKIKTGNSKRKHDGSNENIALVRVADLIDICQRHAMACPRIELAVMDADQMRNYRRKNAI